MQTLLILVLALSPTLQPLQLAPTDAPTRLLQLTNDSLMDKLHLGRDGGVAVSVNLGGGLFTPVSQRLPRTLVSFVLPGDLNGDGLADLYLVSPDANTALLGDGTGRFRDRTQELGLADKGLGLSAERVDLDGLGAPELLLHNTSGDVIFWSDGARFRQDAKAARADGKVGEPGALSMAGASASHGGRVHGKPWAPNPTAMVGGGSTLSPEQARILSHMSLLYVGDGLGTEVNQTLRISGVNLQIVNGLDATNGFPADPSSTDPLLTQVNGLGNLIVGYNEPGNPSGDVRTGSHNIIVGRGQSHQSFGGTLSGRDNSLAAPFASVSGGARNLASGDSASVSGGYRGVASSAFSAVSGGRYNIASGTYASVSGGALNQATGKAATISGGQFNTAAGDYASISGGLSSTAAGLSASVSGGAFGQALGDNSSISGGLVNTSSGRYASVSGGQTNAAIGDNSSVSGGSSRSTVGADDWAAGSLAEDS